VRQFLWERISFPKFLRDPHLHGAKQFFAPRGQLVRFMVFVTPIRHWPSSDLGNPPNLAIEELAKLFLELPQTLTDGFRLYCISEIGRHMAGELRSLWAINAISLLRAKRAFQRPIM
jgi:hypothetical protein